MSTTLLVSRIQLSVNNHLRHYHLNQTLDTVGTPLILDLSLPRNHFVTRQIQETKWETKSAFNSSSHFCCHEAMPILKGSAFVWEVARRLLLLQKVLLFRRPVKVSSQTCGQTTCKYQRYNLPNVFPKLTTSDTNTLEGDFLSGRGWTFPPGFRISRNIGENFNLHFL